MTKATGGRKGCVLTHSFRVQLITAGKSQQQIPERAGHTTATIKSTEQQINTCRLRLTLPFQFSQSRISCLGNGSAHNGQVFLPQLYPSLTSPGVNLQLDNPHSYAQKPSSWVLTVTIKDT